MSGGGNLPGVLTRAIGPLPLWFGLLLLGNLLAVALYWLVRRLRRRERTESFRLRCLVMLLCPLAGPLFFFFGWLYYRLFFHKPVDLDDVIFSKDRTKSFLKADEERERNFVPLEEAIAVTDQSNTRALMMEVVRRDISNSMASISLALSSDDSEVSHYAASVLQETLGKLRMNFQKLWRHIRDLEQEVAEHDTEDGPLRLVNDSQAQEAAQAEPESKKLQSDAEKERERENAVAVAMYREEQRRARNKEESYRQGLLARDGAPDPSAGSITEKLAEEMDCAHNLLDNLRQVLQQKVFSEREQHQYTEMMEQAAALIDLRDVLTAYELEALTDALLDQREYDRCRTWCERSAALYPKALSSITSRLKLCYALGDREAFFDVMRELKSSDVSLDHETLEMLRVFL